MRVWKNIFHANRNDKKTGVAILIPEKKDFKTKFINKRQKRHYMRSIQEENIMLISIQIPNIEIPKYIKQILTNMNKLTIIQQY